MLEILRASFLIAVAGAIGVGDSAAVLDEKLLQNDLSSKGRGSGRLSKGRGSVRLAVLNWMSPDNVGTFREPCGQFQ